jgi:hypothetical protein
MYSSLLNLRDERNNCLFIIFLGTFVQLRIFGFWDILIIEIF